MRRALVPFLLLSACSSSSSPGGSDAGGPDARANADAAAADAANADAASDASAPDALADAGTSDSGDPLAEARANCSFTAGARVADTLGVDPARIPLEHVIVVMKENRSFDHLLGALHDRGQPEVEAYPADFTNRDRRGAAVTPFHAPTTCIAHDPGHQWAAIHAQVNGGRMDGFVTSAADSTGTDGHFVMSFYDDADLPFYYWLANTFALEDRHFASVRSGTFPNRNFLMLGAADGVASTGDGYPDPATPTIFDRLDDAGLSWGVYSDGDLLSGSLNWDLTHRNAHPFAAFIAALDDGSLPAVTFVDGYENIEDDHPLANLQFGEAWLHNVYTHAIASPLWPTAAILFTYDEAGGFADHVPAPNQACIARPIAKDAPFFELGPRIPMMVISPYARPHAVSHQVEEHCAITRFIEVVFDLPALTARDANSTALLELFDFEHAPALMTPPPAPRAGERGCAGGPTLRADRATYNTGDPIHIAFSGAPGDNGLDWIGVYARSAAGTTTPVRGSLAWQYVGGTHVAGAAPRTSTITIDASAIGRGTWPLPAGGYRAFYLLDDGYVAAASLDLDIQ